MGCFNVQSIVSGQLQRLQVVLGLLSFYALDARSQEAVQFLQKSMARCDRAGGLAREGEKWEAGSNFSGILGDIRSVVSPGLTSPCLRVSESFKWLGVLRRFFFLIFNVVVVVIVVVVAAVVVDLSM